MLSFWEKESFVSYDFIIIGGGVIGLSTALSLRERCPKADVLVLERGIWPAGASTKNVGFLSVSTLTEVIADRQALGDNATLGVIQQRRDGIERLRQRLGDSAIGYEPFGGYELLMDKDLCALDELENVNRWLGELFPQAVYRLREDLLDRYGFPRPTVKALVYNPFDAQVHTGKTMRALIGLVQSRGVSIATGTEVIDLNDDAMGVTVIAKDGSGRSIELRATDVAVCTSAWIPRLMPDLNIIPARGQVLITEPIQALPWRGTFNFDQGYYYFRDIGRRVIVGGARHTDRDTETSHELEINPGIHRRLEAVLSEVVLPNRLARIEQRWAGIMGFSESRLPIARLLRPRIAVGFGCNSMGLAMGSAIGERTAEVLVGSAELT